MKRWLVALALAAVAPPLTAQQPTLQQQFDSATESIRAERWEEALSRFEAIEARLGAGNRRTAAIVRVRKAEALLRLGRAEEARAALELGLRDLPEADPTLHEDRFIGLLTLGELAELSLDYAEAQRHYRAAKTVPVPVPLRLSVYRGLIQTRMFDDAAGALADADEALALARSADTGRQHEGVLRTLRGRALLNLGRHGDARQELQGAMQRLGGLTTRVNLADIVARSDLAIAAMLAGRTEDARRYLAYTGAGFHETSFSPSTGDMFAPTCGGELRPEDRAVLEFSVRDDGTVGHVTPVYASRQGESALAFARAALAWGWNPDDFEDVPALFRAAMRVEIRCAQRVPDDDNFRADEAEDALGWYAAHDVPAGPASRVGPLARPAALRAELERRQAADGDQAPTLIEPLLRLARHPSVGPEESARYLRRVLPIAARSGAPGTVVARLVLHLDRDERWARGRRERRDWNALLANPIVRADPRATTAVRIGQASALYAAGEDREAAALIADIRANAGLSADDPLMTDLLALEVAAAAARNDWAAARAAYEAMGPAAEPCRRVPRLRPPNASSRDFPEEALRWGFEGWVAVERIPNRDGDFAASRTILSYPPFVFDESAERIGARSGLGPTWLPDERTCGPIQSVILFRVRE